MTMNARRDAAGSCARNARTGGQALVETLLAQGADLAFCVPGESFLGAMDALYDVQDRFRLIVCRHEAAAANMAEAAGKLTGRPGLCFVTRGPGSAHAAIGVHTARQDSTPLILFVGQVARGHRHREAFQEVDYGQMYGQFAKWAVEIDDPGRIPELVARAFHVAVNGRPGPVVVALPEDILKLPCESAIPPTFKRSTAAPGAAALSELAALIEAAERPLLILGGGGWDAEAVGRMRAFAERAGIPAAVGFRCQDLFDNSHANYIGHLGIGADPALADSVRRADLLLVVGERLGEIPTQGYTLIGQPRPAQRFVHVHPDPDELGIVYPADMLIAATPRDFAAAMETLPLPPAPGRRGWVAAGRKAYDGTLAARANGQPIDPAAIVRHLRESLPGDAILTNGAGSYAVPLHRHYSYRTFRSQLAPTSGAMGYGFPAAIAAKLIHPERTVVCFAGDGCFLMASQELATAIRYQTAVIVVVIDNGSYGSIRLHQERDYPGRVFATDLNNPDFVALARAYGAHGEEVTRTEDFPAAFDRAVASGKPALLAIRIDIETTVAASRGR